MLLRSALNVLHERELKQGTRITKGRIECALMTSNRYLADILEGSRETLLAFVDRIAFVGFVPRGFARRENLGLVLRRHALYPTELRAPRVSLALLTTAAVRTIGGDWGRPLVLDEDRFAPWPSQE